MNRLKSTIAMLAFAFIGFITAQAQELTVAEPDSTSSDLVYYVTPSNTLEALPLETGTIEEHKNKIGKLASIVGGAADAAGALGSIGSIVGAHTGSLNTVLSGIEVMGTASNVGDLADVANALAGAEGHDFTYKPSKSSKVIKIDGKDLNILVNLKCKDKETALGVLKIVRFKTTKSDRRLRWLQTKAALIDTEKSKDADKAGYLSFGYQAYGDHCSLLTIPATELKQGEYGVYCLANMFGANLSVLCYTFSVE